MPNTPTGNYTEPFFDVTVACGFLDCGDRHSPFRPLSFRLTVTLAMPSTLGCPENYGACQWEITREGQKENPIKSPPRPCRLLLPIYSSIDAPSVDG